MNHIHMPPEWLSMYQPSGTTHLTVRMPEKACAATEDMRASASLLLRSTALVCCLYSDAVKAAPTITPAAVCTALSRLS